MYEGRTMDEAVRKWQKDALPHVEELSRIMGITLDTKKEWIETGHTKGMYYRKGERDKIKFIPGKTEKVRRTIGEIAPAGERKQELALVDDVGPNDFDSQESLSWTRGKSLELSKAESETLGWSVTVTQGIEIGGEAAGVKYIAGLEIGSSGDYTKEKAEAKQDSWDATHTTTIELPKGNIARLVQLVETGPVAVEIEDFITLSLGWKVLDYKHRTNDYLKGHEVKNSSTRTRCHWDCVDTYDLLSMMEGINPRYPNISPKHSLPYKAKKHFNWLLNEKNRVIHVKSKATFNQGIWGNAKVQLLGVDGELYDESNAE